MKTPVQILRASDVQKRLGVARATIYRLLDKDPSFPRPLKIGSYSVGWIEEEIDAWLKARIRAARPEVAA